MELDGVLLAVHTCAFVDGSEDFAVRRERGYGSGSGSASGLTGFGWRCFIRLRGDDVRGFVWELISRELC